ncbi:MAG: N-(5-phosphoribosyl)anthranilate isomerase [Pedobacter sp.]|jgi:phosphoribosylanthranilate isomerase|nr:N-(5-phosphoribosyl)anthranilate isomerase [Pedobacter sp.]
MEVKLKICGMKVPDNIAQVVELSPDYLGFIFYKGSKRYIDDLQFSIVHELPRGIKATGVFVDEDLDTVISHAKAYNLAALQLHGHESPQYCLQIMSVLPLVEVIKAFGIDETFDFSSLDAYIESVDYFLFDTQTANHGGSGKAFNWSLLENYKGQKPYFLSGGIGIEEAAALNKIQDPRLYALDINSRFELEPGLKDLNKLKEFRNILSGIAQ